jgi:hypothetical protein
MPHNFLPDLQNLKVFGSLTYVATLQAHWTKIVYLPLNIKPIVRRWVYKVKYMSDGSIYREM